MKRFQRLFSGTSAAVLTLSSLLSVGFTGVAHAATQTCDWIGGTDLLFSTAANWSNCGSGAPLAGDIIRFDNASVPAAPANGVAPTVLTNDLNVGLGGVETYYSTTSGNSQMYISTLKLADGGYFEATSAASLTSDLYLTIGTVANGATYVTSGDITNNGSVNIKSSGLSFRSLSTGYSNMTITLGDGASLMSSQVNLNSTGTTLALQKGSNFSVYLSQASTSNEYAIVAGGGSGTTTPKLYVSDYASYDSTTQKTIYPGTNVTFSGNITLNSDLDVQAGSRTSTTVSFTGTVSGSGAITRNKNSVGKLITPAGELTNPANTTALDGDVSGWDGRVTVNQNETAILNGTRATMFVKPAGTLKGTGTVTGYVGIDDGAHVAPGNSPGCLTVGQLSLAGEYQFELGGADPCTGYDQIKVTDLTAGDNSTALDSTTAVLTTSRFDGYTPTQGQVFTIIDNQGPDAVNGTFKDLAEGANFEQNGVVFKISYVGGTGNDVTLTVQNVPTAPDTGFALVSANPIVSLSLMAAAAGALMIMARRFRPAHAVAHKTTRRRK